MPLPRLAAVHRWFAVALTPVFLLILLSGAGLAFAPRSRHAREQANFAARMDPTQVRALLAKADPKDEATFLWIQDDRKVMAVVDKSGEQQACFDLATGAAAPDPPDPKPDFFDALLRLHKNLWFGDLGLVGLATIAMAFLVLAGPFLTRPRSGRRSALGWHTLAGWALWPLLLLLPLSVGLMKLHPPIGLRRGQPPLPLAVAFDQAAKTLDLSHLKGLRPLPGGAAMAVIDEADGRHRYIIRSGGVSPLDTRASRLGHALHEGTWGAGWGGMVNLLAVLGLLAMMGTGLLSWWRRRNAARATAAA